MNHFLSSLFQTPKMKKVSLVICASIVVAATSFYSCKKTPVASIENKQGTEVVHKMTSSASLTVSVSSRGFLVFLSPDATDAFATYLQTNTLQTIKNYYAQLGFRCLNNATIFSGDLSKVPTDDQLSGLMLSDRGVMEVSGTVFKPTSNNAYLLTMSESVLNDVTFASLNNGQFVSTYMNRFAVSATRGPDFNLWETIATSPSGIGESSTGAASLMKFWGTTTSYGPCNPPLGKIQYTTHYAFWMGSTTVDGYVPC
jgi:hypothetical protein